MGMDRQEVIDSFEGRIMGGYLHHGGYIHVPLEEAEAILSELKGPSNLFGIRQTADGLTFFSTGSAKQGEERGLLFGKLMMHEWLEKELLYRGLLTDDIRSVFAEATTKLL